MLHNIPAYSQNNAEQIIDLVTSSVVAQRGEIRKFTTDKTASVYDRSFGMFVEVSKAILEAGFGLGVVIVSGNKSQAVNALEEQMEKLVTIEEAIRAKSLGIARVNPVTNTVDVKAEVPSWSKTVGSSLPSWSDAKSKQDLVVLIINQLRTNIQVIKAFKDAGGGSGTQTALAASTMLHTEFLLGILEGFIYAKPADIKAMTATFRMTVNKVPTDASIIEYFTKVKEILQKIDVTGLIAAAVAGSK